MVYSPKLWRVIMSAKHKRFWFRGGRPVDIDGKKRWLHWRKFKRILRASTALERGEV